MKVQQRIILATIELMSRQGVKHTTMDDVAHALSISKRTIYEKFADKVSLIVAVLEHIYAESDRNSAEVQQRCGDIIEELFEMLRVMERDFLVRGKITRDIERHYPDIYQKICIPQFEKLFYEVSQRLNGGIGEGLFVEGTNTHFATFFILESINAMLNNAQKVQKITGVLPFETVKLIFVNVFRGIATNRGIQKIDSIIKQQN